MKKGLSNNFVGQNLADEAKLRNRRALNNFTGDVLVTEDSMGESITIKLTHKSSSVGAKRIVLFPGALSSTAEVGLIAGFTPDAIASNGEIITDVIDCDCEVMSYLQKFVAKNPTRITEMQISVDNQLQLANPIRVTRIHPAMRLGTQSFIPRNFQKAGDSNTLMVNIPFKHFQIDDQTVVDVVVGTGRTITITLFLGACRNDAKTLDSAAKAALGE